MVRSSRDERHVSSVCQWYRQISGELAALLLDVGTDLADL